MKLLSLLKIDLDKKRTYGLDILRAFAILFVVFIHGVPIFSGQATRRILSYFAFDGVAIFFVLSGFLIGGILIRNIEKKGASFKTLLSFWIKRWFRTLPNYFLVLTLLVCILPFLYTGALHNPLPYWKYFLFIQNFHTPHPNFFGEAWSLAIEEWFYLLVPALIFILTGGFRIKPKNSILITSCLVIVLVTSFRYYRYVHSPAIDYHNWDISFRKQVVTNLDSLMYGVLGAFLAFYYLPLWTKHKKLLLIAGLIILVMQQFITVCVHGFGLYKCVFTFSVTSLGTLLLIPFLNELKTGRGIAFTAFTYISLISYSLYLVHHHLLYDYFLNYLSHYFSGTTLVIVQYSCYWIFSILLSTLLYKYFEKPTTRLRDKFL